MLEYRPAGGRCILYTTEGRERGEAYHLFDMDSGRDHLLDLGNPNQLYVAEEELRILWTAYEEDGSAALYTADLTGGGFSKQALAADVTYVDATGDLQTVVYLSGDTLYRLKGLKHEEKVAGNVSEFWLMKDTGSVYYLADVEYVSLPAPVEDDMEEQDYVLRLPDKAQYQTIVMAEDGTVASVLNEERFYEDLERYYDKLKRDEIRGRLRYGESYARLGGLYYSQAGAGTKLADYVGAAQAWDWPGDVLLAQRCDPAAAQTPLKMSEIRDLTAYLDVLKEQDDRISLQNQLIMGGAVSDLPFDPEVLTEDHLYGLDAAHDRLYYISDLQENGGTLYSVSCQGGVLGEAGVIDTGVNGILTGGEEVIYTKGNLMADGNSSLCTAGGQIDTGLYGVNVCRWQGGALYYMKNIDEQGNHGVLCRWKDGQVQQIADGVAQFEFLPDGAMLMLKDYDDEQKAGNLWLWKEGEELILVDSGVKGMKRLELARLIGGYDRWFY